MLDETAGNRGRVIVSKWWLSLHHALIMLEQGMDNFHQFIFLINDTYEPVAALEELLDGKPFKTDDYIRLSPLGGSKTCCFLLSNHVIFQNVSEGILTISYYFTEEKMCKSLQKHFCCLSTGHGVFSLVIFFFLCDGLEIRLWVFSLLLGHMIVSSWL